MNIRFFTLLFFVFTNIVLVQADENNEQDIGLPSVTVSISGGALSKIDKIKVTAIGYEGLTDLETAYVQQIYLTFLTFKSNNPGQSDYQATMAELQYITQNHPGATLNARLYSGTKISGRFSALGTIGYRLSNDYDNSDLEGGSNNDSKEEVFYRARNSVQGDGGICGPIHDTLNDVQSALGFVNVGLHSVIWKQDGGSGQGIGHILSHFQDPETGKYYLQNYYTIIDLHTTNFREAIERSLAIHGPLTGNTLLETRTEMVRQLEGRRSRWIYYHLSRAGYQGPEGASADINLTNVSQEVLLRYGINIANLGQASIFAGHSRFQAAEGDHNLSYFGAAIVLEKRHVIEDSFFDEIFINLKGFLAAHRYQNPRISPFSGLDGETWVRYSGAFELDTSGELVMGDFTAKANLVLRTQDIGNILANDSSRIYQHFDLGVEYIVPVASMFSIEYETRINVVPRELADDGNLTVKFVYDKFTLDFDTRRAFPDNPFFIHNTSDLFFLDGFYEYSGMAVRNRTEIGIQLKEYGSIALLSDLDSVIQNCHDDPLYGEERQLAGRFGLQYSCQPIDNLTLTASAGYNLSNPRLYFIREQGNHRPDQSREQAGYFGELKIQYEFGDGLNIDPKYFDNPIDIPHRQSAYSSFNFQSGDLILYYDQDGAIKRVRIFKRYTNRPFNINMEARGSDERFHLEKTLFATSINDILQQLETIPGFNAMYVAANSQNDDWRGRITQHFQ